MRAQYDILALRENYKGINILDSFERQWQRWFPEEKDKKSEPSKGGWTATRILSILGGLVVMFIFLSVGKGFYTEWLWYSDLGYGSVFTTILRTRILVFFLAILWFWAKKWATLEGPVRTASDFQLVGYVFFLIAMWYLCGALARPYQAALAGQPLRSPLSIIVYLVLGWLFLFLSHYKSAQMIQKWK